MANVAYETLRQDLGLDQIRVARPAEVVAPALVDGFNIEPPSFAPMGGAVDAATTGERLGCYKPTLIRPETIGVDPADRSPLAAQAHQPPEHLQLCLIQEKSFSPKSGTFDSAKRNV
jgi:hypothetical protein